MYPPFTRHRARLHHHQGNTAHSTAAEMNPLYENLIAHIREIQPAHHYLHHST